jgi:iron complex outermembrane receptor protein
VDLALSGTYERSSGAGRLYFPEFDAAGTNRGIAENLDGEQVGSVYGQLRLHDFTVTATFGRRLKDVPTASYSTMFNSQQPGQDTTDVRTLVHAQYGRVVRGTRVAADLSFDRLSYDGTFPFVGESTGAPLLIGHNLAIGTRWGVAGRATRPLPGANTLTIGGEFVGNVTQKLWRRFNDPRIPDFTVDKSSQQSAVYLQDEIRIRPWLLVNAGVRFDQYDLFERTTPRGAVIVIPSTNQSFKYLYGRAFRAPNAYELYYFNDATSYLRPESVDTHEVAWEQYVGDWLRTSISAYRYSASQLITFEARNVDESVFNADEFAFFNAGLARAKGIEVESEVRSRRGFQMLGSYTHQRVQDRTNTPLANSPTRMAKMRLSTPAFDRSVGAIEVLYVAPRRTLAGAFLPATTIAHATFSARVTSSIEVVAAVRNLFNQRYGDPASGAHVPDIIQQNGRTARVGVRWRLWTPPR